ncbi:IclR family transcriptional regulator [Phreatobacter sp. AB_2022a]|uniref:IclR family transcriptional regulator n=1 Tax=Phreatobacter sp. AB_2022a TaxID=3003134 RepID=UPI0022874D30|nr:IclR family transcriptional regulator [Phreatobacter sp. AB_2022a]MCZ0736324.1 IclR family transcriptional regulator [Phreatobacter sp. AB_2022a]
MSKAPVNIETEDGSSAAAGAAGVGLLKKALQILDLFTEERPNWTQADLARETKLARSTLGRLVRFLSAAGYLMEQRGRYTLGFAAIDLGRRAQLQFDLVGLCQSLLEDLAQATAETVILTGYDEIHASVVCLAQIPSRQGGLRVFENIGTAYPLHSGATAKAVLAFLAQQQIDSILRGDLTGVNPATTMSADALRRQIEEVRAAGFVVTYEETYPGVVGIAVPVLTPRRQPLGSIAIAAPIQRMDQARIDAYAKLLVDVGRRSAARVAGDAKGGE